MSARDKHIETARRQLDIMESLAADDHFGILVCAAKIQWALRGIIVLKPRTRKKTRR